MAFETLWYKTKLPEEMIDLLVRDLKEADKNLDTAQTRGGVDLERRDSKVSWISENYWVSGLLWHYIMVANRNFGYDISGWDQGSLQYTSYKPGQYYHWHRDDGVTTLPSKTGDKAEDFILDNTSTVRKLSVTVQLSSWEDYKGGEVQFIDDSGNTFFAPKERGTIIVFDSRVKHRCRKVVEGERKSIVGWVVGPRWR